MQLRAHPLELTVRAGYLMSIPADDTHPDARAAQLRWLRPRTEEERLRLAIELSEEVRELSRCGIRARHPDYAPEQVEWALRRLVFGDELFRAVRRPRSSTVFIETMCNH